MAFQSGARQTLWHPLCLIKVLSSSQMLADLRSCLIVPVSDRWCHWCWNLYSWSAQNVFNWAKQSQILPFLWSIDFWISLNQGWAQFSFIPVSTCKWIHIEFEEQELRTRNQAPYCGEVSEKLTEGSISQQNGKRVWPAGKDPCMWLLVCLLSHVMWRNGVAEGLFSKCFLRVLLVLLRHSSSELLFPQ